MTPTATTSGMWITAMLIALMMMWGGSFVAIKIGLRYLTPFEMVLARFIPSALMFMPVVYWARRRSGSKLGYWRSLSSKERITLVVMALLAVPVYHYCLNMGETMIPAGWAGLVISLNPAAIVFFAAWLLKEVVGFRRIAGIALAFAGLLFIAITNNALTDSGDSVPLVMILIGMAIIMGAVVSWGVFTVYSKRLIQKHDTMTTISWVIFIGTIWLLPGLRPEFFRKLALAPLELWWAILFLSAGCTVVGFMVWYYALERWQASRAGVFIYIVPLAGLIIGNVMLDEVITIYTAIGVAGVLGGVFLAGKRNVNRIPTEAD